MTSFLIWSRQVFDPLRKPMPLKPQDVCRSIVLRARRAVCVVVHSVLLHHLDVVLLLQFGSVSRAHNGYQVDKAKTYLPLLHLSGLRVVLLRELCQNLLQTLEVRLQRRDNIFHSPLGKNTVDHPEALAVPRERLQRLQNSPKTL